MEKINRNYFSLYGLWLRDFPLAPTIYRFFYPEKYNRIADLLQAPFRNDWRVYRHQRSLDQPMLGGLQAFLDMAKDVQDTLRPYKTAFQMKRDFLQPLRGLGNMVTGLATLMLTPIFFMTRFIEGAFRRDHRYSFIKFYAKVSFSWLIEAAAKVIRGLTQIVTTPLTWLVKMPLRSLLTAVYGAPAIEDSKSIQKLVATSKSQLAHVQDPQKNTHTNAIRYELHRKFLKAIRRRQNTEISIVEEDDCFQAQGRSSTSMQLNPHFHKQALDYLGLFKQKKTITKTSKSVVPASVTYPPSFSQKG